MNIPLTLFPPVTESLLRVRVKGGFTVIVTVCVVRPKVAVRWTVCAMLTTVVGMEMVASCWPKGTFSVAGVFMAELSLLSTMVVPSTGAAAFRLAVAEILRPP